MTISKLNGDKLEKMIKITHVKVTMFGELKNVRKIIIF